MIYLQIILWWAVVPAVAIVAGCGIWNVISYCRREHRLAQLWDDGDTFPRHWVHQQARQHDREGDAA